MKPLLTTSCGIGIGIFLSLSCGRHQLQVTPPDSVSSPLAPLAAEPSAPTASADNIVGQPPNFNQIPLDHISVPAAPANCVALLNQGDATGNAAWIYSLYQSILCRKPDIGGFLGWYGYIYASQPHTRADVLQGFYGSTEFNQIVATGFCPLPTTSPTSTMPPPFGLPSSCFAQ